MSSLLRGLTLPDSITDVLSETMTDVLSKWTSDYTSPPGTLYHYTSADGMVGILKSLALWMTDIRYMNDLSELQYGNDILAERIDARLAKDNFGVSVNEFLNRCRRSVGSSPPGAATYSTSFCQDGNLLSQWRAYRGRGGGYAIGFDFVHTLRLLDKPCVLVKMTYDQHVQVESLDDAIGVFLNLAEPIDISTEVGNGLLAEVVRAFMSVTGALISAFKHPAFKEEHEWRLIYRAYSDPRINRGADMPNVRTYAGNVIPYYEVSFAKAIEASKDDTLGIRFPIVELAIGPTINARLNTESVRSALLGLAPDVEHRVVDSDIPLRWL
jgi:DUF2971 family protein